MMYKRAWIALLFVLAACGGREGDAKREPGRLPVVDAPLDTLEQVESMRDSGLVLGDGGELQAPAWTEARLAGWPAPSELPFTRYTNAQYGFSIAYPDSLLRPASPIGEGRGMEFVSGAADVRMIVYAIDDESGDDLASQYQSAIEDREVQITYRARDDDFYIVAGRRGEMMFYEKALVGRGRVKTFRIQYPVAHKAYFDAVTTLIAASFQG